jgi:hypothetical protein
MELIMNVFKIYSCVIIVVLLIFTNCRDEKKADLTPKNAKDTLYQGENDYKLLVDVINSIENAIMKDPTNITLQQDLLSISYDSTTGSLLTVGNGVYNNELNSDLKEELRTRGARTVAQRWALYMHNWFLQKSIQFGDTVSGTITYDKELYSHTNNDTLFLLLQIPFGSIGN